MNIYFVISEELTEVIWESMFDNVGHKEAYNIVELVVARNPSQARYLAIKPDKTYWSQFYNSILDIPRMSVRKLGTGNFGEPRLVTREKDFEEWWDKAVEMYPPDYTQEETMLEPEEEWRAEDGDTVWIVRNSERVLCTMAVGSNAERDAHKVACVQRLLDFCEDASSRPSEARKIFAEQDFVFNNTGGRWEKLAFTLYTMIASTAAAADRLMFDAEVLPLPEFGTPRGEEI